MKTLLVIPFVFLVVSCATPRTPQVILPPVTLKAPPKVKEVKEAYQSPVSVTKEAEEVVKNPLAPDPVSVTPVTRVPRFQVPENLQPKVTDGINQGEFIELKW